MKKLTRLEFKKFVENKENIEIVKTLFEAITLCEIITEIVNNKQREILARHKFQSEEIRTTNRTIEPIIITEIKDVYMMKESDLTIFLAELDMFYYTDECPIKPSKPGKCPALEAECLVRDLKVQIADKFESTLTISYNDISRNLEFYKQYYEFILQLFAPHVKKLTK
jgi:hypothetical protein